MLRHIPAQMPVTLLTTLAEMGHGDDLVLVDRNYPAFSTASLCVTGRVIELPGMTTTQAAELILALMPLDTYVPSPVRCMAVVGDPEATPAVHLEMQQLVYSSMGERSPLERVERFAFYEAASHGYAVVLTSEARPHGCFLLKKGVIFD